MLIEIRRWTDGVEIFSGDYESVRQCVSDAVEKKRDLRSADLSFADLRSANLRSADLSSADLRSADLGFAYLSSANLRSADLDKKYRFVSIFPIGSESGCLWAMLDCDGILKYNRGCFSGTKEEFLAAVTKKHAGTKFEKIYINAVNFIES